MTTHELAKRNNVRPEIIEIARGFADRGDESLTMLNCTIIPSGAEEGEWVIKTVTTAEAELLVRWAGIAMDENHGWLRSAIGHEATAVAFKAAVGQGWVDRTPWDGAGYGLALQLNGRLPEGKIATLEEMEAIGYSFRLIYRGGRSLSARVRDLEALPKAVAEMVDALRGYLEEWSLRAADRGFGEIPVAEQRAWNEYASRRDQMTSPVGGQP